MAADITWTEVAIEQLADIADCIALDSTRNATATVRRIIDSVDSLARLPLQGRVVPEFGHEYLREVLCRNFRVIYRLRSDGIRIIAVVHGARSLDDLIFDDERAP